MRLQRNRIKEYNVFRCVESVDEEANTSVEYVPSGTIKGIKYNMQGRRTLEKAGETDRYTVCIKVDGPFKKKLKLNGEMSYKVGETALEAGDAILADVDEVGESALESENLILTDGENVLITDSALVIPNYKIRAVIERENLVLELETI